MTRGGFNATCERQHEADSRGVIIGIAPGRRIGISDVASVESISCILSAAWHTSRLSHIFDVPNMVQTLSTSTMCSRSAQRAVLRPPLSMQLTARPAARCPLQATSCARRRGSYWTSTTPLSSRISVVLHKNAGLMAWAGSHIDNHCPSLKVEKPMNQVR